MEQALPKNPSPIAGSLAFVGDIFIPEKVTALHFTDELQALLDACIIRSCNLEAPIQGYGTPQPKAGPHLCQSAQAPDVLGKAGFNLVNLANNHICDYGLEALEATRKACPMPTVGAGTTAEQAFRPAFFTAGDFKIGFLSFGEAEFGAIIEQEGGFAWVNHPRTNALVQATKAQCDYLFVQVHAGVEETELPLPEWRARYRELVELGADAVIASHPHIVQGWEEHQGKPIFYSLGNFFFDRPHAPSEGWNRGLLVRIHLHADHSLSYDCHCTQRNGQEVSVMHDTDQPGYLESRCHLLRPEADYLQQADLLAVRLWEERYRRHYENAVNGVTTLHPIHLLKFFKRLLFNRPVENLPLLVHNTRIESHAWVVRRACNILYKQHNQNHHGTTT